MLLQILTNQRYKTGLGKLNITASFLSHSDFTWTKAAFTKKIQRIKRVTQSSFSESRSGILVSKVTQSCPTLYDPVDCSPPGSSIHGILQPRILEWVAISFSRGSSWPRDWTQVSRIAGRRFNLWATREAQKQHKKQKARGGGPTVSIPRPTIRNTICRASSQFFF